MALTVPANVFLVLLLFRLVNAFTLRTFFQPDEYFQALEPAWQLAFGPDSGAWMTWEWRHQLRSSLHPIIFAAAYKLAELLTSWTPSIRTVALLAAPRAVQAVFAALGDWATWRLASKLFGHGSRAATCTLLLTALNPWQWYCSTRTFSNSLEMTLTALGLACFPWSVFSPAAATASKPAAATQPSTPGALVALLFAALATILRPTNVFIWLAVLGQTLLHLARTSPSPSAFFQNPNLRSLLLACLASAAAVLSLSSVADRLFFGFWTFPAYTWLYFNISQSLAIFYGVNPWHFYLFQGIPLLTTTCLPFVVRGILRPAAATASARKALWTLDAAVFSAIVPLSVISHKEVRFIYPLLPIFHVLAAPYASAFFASPASAAGSGSGSGSPRLRPGRAAYLAAAVLANVLIATFLAFLHQPAPMSVVTFLREQYALSPTPADVPFVAFLMPCHSTPWRSHLVHANLSARALTCEPPLHTAPGSRERRDYRDEADRFYDDPLAFLRREMWPRVSGSVELPKYVAGFEGIEPWLVEFLQGENHGAGAGAGYSLTRAWEGWNGFFSEDSRRAGSMVVWSLGPPQAASL